VTIEYLDEPIGVSARLDAGGHWLPLAFVWRGRQYRILEWGRQHNEDVDGQRHHLYLVQTENQETWELRYAESNGEWRLLRHWRRSYLAI
jgi:hypothetical protein